MPMLHYSCWPRPGRYRSMVMSGSMSSMPRPRPTKALVDLFGTIVFLFPVVIAVAVLSVPYIARSWTILEGSREASGLPFVYLLKTLIPLFAILLGSQGVAQAIRAALVLAEPRRGA